MKLSSYCDYVLPVLDVCIQCREHAIFVGRCALEIVNGAAALREACSYFRLEAPSWQRVSRERAASCSGTGTRTCRHIAIWSTVFIILVD